MLIAARCQNPLESAPLRRPFPGQRQALPQQVLKPVPPRDLPPLLFQHIFQRSVIPSPPLDCFPAPSHLLHPPGRFLELESSYGGVLLGEHESKGEINPILTGAEILETPCSDPGALEEPGPNMALAISGHWQLFLALTPRSVPFSHLLPCALG